MVHCSEEGTQNPDGEGLQMVQQPGHTVHFNNPTATKPGKESVLPRLKVFFNGRQQGGKVEGEYVLCPTGQKYAQIFDV